MRARLELALLVVAGLAVVAFLISFGLGLRHPAGDAPASDAASASALVADAPPDTDAPVSAPAGPRVRVEVLNGTGRGGLARRATERLRADGFDVIYFGNAGGARRDSTLVLDRSGRPGAARAVVDALGAGRVQSKGGAPPDIDVTVVLGRDWPAAADPGPGGDWLPGPGPKRAGADTTSRR